MREIKFRAKVKYPENFFGKRDIAEGEWVSGDLHMLCHYPHIHTDKLKKYPIDTNTVCEFTGAHDKFRTPIYEGDIVRFHLRERKKGDAEYQEGTIVYEGGMFFARLNKITHYLCGSYQIYEVIGNRFDTNKTK